PPPVPRIQAPTASASMSSGASSFMKRGYAAVASLAMQRLTYRRRVDQLVDRLAEIIEGRRGIRRPIAGVDDIGPVDPVAARHRHRGGPRRAAGTAEPP